MSNKTVWVFMVAISQTRGVSPIYAAFLVSITGTADIVGRLVTGVLLSISGIKSHQYVAYAGFLFLVTLALLLVPTVETFGQYSVVFCVFGIFSGAFEAQKSVVVADMLGTADIFKSLGIMYAFQGVGVILGMCVSGLIKDWMGDYDGVFYFAGAGMAMSGVLVLVIMVFRNNE